MNRTIRVLRATERSWHTTEIAVGAKIDTVEYDYPTFHLSMDCFWAEVISGDLVLREHEAARWLAKQELYRKTVGLYERLRDKLYRYL